MDDLFDLLRHQGYVLRREALALGWHDRSLRQAVRAGHLVRARHGTYVDAPRWRAASPADRLAMLSVATLARLGPGYVLSHASAAAVHGLDLFGTDLTTVHVTSTGQPHGRVEAGVVHHEGALDEADIVVVRGVPVVRAPRAVVETACAATVEGTVVTACSALHRGLADDDTLLSAIERLARHKGIRGARLGLSLADAGCHSAGEARSLYLCWRHRLPRPQCQHEVRDSRGLAGIVDMAWLDWHHVGEFDGLVKYGRRAPWSSDPVTTLVAEKSREDRIRETGLGMTRWTWHDLEPTRAGATAERIRSALERSRARYSTPA